MQVLAGQVSGYIERASWIRRMFESGIELKKQYGADNVCDFSLGNPDLPPPAGVGDALRDLADRISEPLVLGYMPNGGYPAVREMLAEFLSREQGCELGPDQVVMTCGAAGAINALFRAVLEPGDEVVCPTPFFVEYGFYVENFGGKLVTLPPNPPSFELDLDAIRRAITPRTRAVLINSPNNPAGCIYSQDSITALGEVLTECSKGRERPLFLVSDEPYRYIAYDGQAVAPVLPAYTHSILVGSFSKVLSLAGERIGYLAANPAIDECAELMGGVTFTNRTLGFVNAPAIGQLLVSAALGAEVDVAVYDARRRAMASVLTEAGIEFAMPQGAFYFFPRIPVGEDDTAFVRQLMEERILAVPGSGFGCPGYFRLAFCLDAAIIERSRDGFKRAVARG